MKNCRRYLKKILFIFFIQIVGIINLQGQSVDSISFESPLQLYDYIDSTSTKGYEKGMSPNDKIQRKIRIIEGAEKLSLDSLVSEYSYKLSITYIGQNSIAKAFYYANKSYSYLDKIKDERLKANVPNILGKIYSIGGDKENALNKFFQSIDLFKKVDPNSITYPLGNISEIYYEMGDFENAIKYTREAATYSKKMKGSPYFYNYGFDCYRLSDWYGAYGYQDSSDYYMHLSLNLVDSLNANKINQQELIYYIYENATLTYLRHKDFLNAQKYLDKAIQNVNNLTKDNSKVLLGKYYFATNDKSALLLLIEDLKQKKDFLDYEKGWEFLEEVYQEYGMHKEQVFAIKNLEKIAKKKFNTQQKQYALFTAYKFEDLKRKEEINHLKKQQQIAELQIQNQKAFFITGGLICCLLIGGVFFMMYRDKQNKNFSKKLQNDVTEKTKHLQLLNQDLAGKNEELHRFNYILSHDLKEPLRSIVGFSTLIKKQIKADEKLEGYADYIINSGKQLNSLIDDIHEYQKVSMLDLKYQKFNLKTLIQKVESRLSKFIHENNAKIIYSNLPFLENSESAIFILCRNIIENGIKYNRNPIPTISISCIEEIEYTKIFIKDNGIGIDEKYFEQVFGMFTRLNNRKEFTGSGIGMAICKKIAPKVNGTIEIYESIKGEGTTFLLTLNKTSAQNIQSEILSNMPSLQN